METQNKAKYYIFTPARFCSGGPEALHQLAYYMRKLGMDAYTVFYTYSGFPDVQPIDRYKQYEVSVVGYGEIEDKTYNYVIAPENAPWCLNGFKQAQKCIWWLSVAYNDVREGTAKVRLVHFKRKMLRQDVGNYRNVAFNIRNCWHLCGSAYAFEEVTKMFPSSVVKYMVEPISLDFLKMGNDNLPTKREDEVLYNPSKPSIVMNKLLERGRFNYVPLKGLTPEGLAEKYKSAKLYVDFGLFGGPERMPKEAVYFGCNILVACHNASTNNFDVAIPQQYKVKDETSVEQIENCIANMLAHYENQNIDFLPFKEKVERLEANFMEQLIGIFCKA